MDRAKRRATGTRRTAKKRSARRDPIADDFGPGPETDVPPPAETAGAAPSAAPEEPGARAASGRPPLGPIPGLACAGDACVLKPAADLLSRFAARLGPRHLLSFSHAAVSGIELMKALRDFLDAEIAIAERASGKGGTARGYEKISLD